MADSGLRTPNGAGRTVEIPPEPLIRVGARPGFWAYLRELWAFRHFITYDSKSKVSTANSTDSLGRVWMVVNPILFGLAFFFVFGLLLQLSRDVEFFIGYLVIGVFMFRFATGAISSAAKSIVNNQNVVRAFNFPRAALPIATVVRELFAHVPVFLVMAFLVLVIGDVMPGDGSTRITWMWLIFFPVLALVTMMATGLGLLLARAVSAHEDIQHVISFSTRIWFYLSCVFFSPDRFAHIEWMVTAMSLNPMFCALDIIRDAWLYDSFADPSRWIVLGSWALVSLVAGSIVFWQGEETYGRER